MMKNRIAGSLHGYVLSPFGNIDGFGDFGGISVLPGAAGNAFTFQESWSSDDYSNADSSKGWWADSNYWKLNDGGWDGPPDDATTARAVSKFNAIKKGIDASSASAVVMGDTYVTAVSDAVKAVDANTKKANWVGKYSDSDNRQRSVLMVNLKNAVTRLANATVPALWPDIDTGGLTSGTGAGGAVTTNDIIAQQQLKASQDLKTAQAALAAAQKGSVSTPGILGTASTDNTMLYIGGAVGLVALLGVGIMLSKKKA